MAKHKRLLWRLFPSYLFITLISLAAVTWYAFGSLQAFYFQELVSQLETRAKLVREQVEWRLPVSNPEYLLDIGRQFNAGKSNNISIVLASGTINDNREVSQSFKNLESQPPEIVEALSGRRGKATRFDYPSGADTLFVAIPINREGRVVAALRVSMPLKPVEDELSAIRLKIIMGGLITALLAAGISYLVAMRISSPIEKIKSGAERFARGDLSHRLPVFRSEELGGLAETMNKMASQLNERIKAVVRQRNELEAVLSSMVEAVLAVDVEERIISVNQAAGELFDIDPAAVQGKSMQEAIRNPDLQRFVKKALAGDHHVEADVVARGEVERTLQGHGAKLVDAEGERIGAVVVLNDITQLRKLETMRQDFVANVSHEIKTPITAIKGFVETLRDGALSDPEDARRFLTIIQKHIDRLNVLIEDLLKLSRIEQDKSHEQIELVNARICEVLSNAAQVCAPQARTKEITIETICDTDLTASINPPLLEQAVVNLLDNAIKYSDAGKAIRLDTYRTNSEVVIRTIDQGCGIEEQYLTRIFERFYRVDKARSRKLGGTGLGLAIVKHITQSHGGHVTVDSVVGKGSEFRIHLPRPDDQSAILS